MCLLVVKITYGHHSFIEMAFSTDSQDREPSHTTLTLFQPVVGGGGVDSPSRFFPLHHHKNQPIDSKLTFNFYYRDII